MYMLYALMTRLSEQKPSCHSFRVLFYESFRPKTFQKHRKCLHFLSVYKIKMVRVFEIVSDGSMIHG